MNDRNRNCMDIAYYIRKDLCFNTKNPFSISIGYFFEVFIPKVIPIAIRIFYLQMQMILLNKFSNDFQQTENKLLKVIFSKTLISTYFKIEN